MNEMLLVYIYGIYPEGGITTLFMVPSLIVIFAAIIKAGPLEEVKEAKEFLRYFKPLFIATAVVATIGYFIPSKNAFLTMVATPHIIESLENKAGKLNKLDRLLDKALDEALKEDNE